jgi:hypothetical protein
MGYTHYWYRPQNLNKETFLKFSADCKKIFDFCENEMGIKLADGVSNLDSKPEADDKTVCFNGSEDQPAGVWTTTEEIMIPWPSEMASLSEVNADPCANKTDGEWYAGTSVSQRVAPIKNNTGKGSGSYETVMIECDMTLPEWKKADKETGLFFDCCKTAYRPYDLAVTAVLISFKHYFPEVVIASDGEEKDWLDGKFLCRRILGYGMDFYIDRD